MNMTTKKRKSGKNTAKLDLSGKTNNNINQRVVGNMMGEHRVVKELKEEIEEAKAISNQNGVSNEDFKIAIQEIKESVKNISQPQAKKIGRPIKETEHLDQHYSFKLTKSESDILKRKSIDSGVSISFTIRKALKEAGAFK